MITPQDVVDEARTWIGTRFHHQASVKGVGTDCIGLVAGVAAALHMPEAHVWLQDVRRRSYTAQPDPKMLLEAAAEYLIEVPISTMTVADIALMRVPRGSGAPQHFGIISADRPRYLIHAYAQMRKVVETNFEPWQTMLMRAYRYRGLA